MDETLDSQKIPLSALIAPSFHPLHRAISKGRYTHHWLSGGRGSTKSSFVSLELIVGMMRDGDAGKQTHAVVLRRYAVTLRESVYAQLNWAIYALGVGQLWKAQLSPMSMTYLPTGQKIIFRGADDPMKLKSLKIDAGYFKYAWYEECNEFEGEEKLRTINQSILRGGEDFAFFYSFNPPKSKSNWCNVYVMEQHPQTVCLHTTYRTVPRQWLGEQFFVEAEHLRDTKPNAYDHEYLGLAVGCGEQVFENITLRPIAQEERDSFDQLRHGIDWGYAADPFVFNQCHYDKTRRRLYVLEEVHQVRLSNRQAAEKIAPIAQHRPILCDSAEPKSIAELKDYGLRVSGAKKGPDSVSYGIKWLQDLEEIIIDSARCPNTAREFSQYELARDKDGNLMAQFPDKDNHHIDAIRYACQGDMGRTSMKVLV
ncbi:PBSX family phage terminase large subunit [Bengtsoniella intestinalis]|uniref:PBSX family phage terminase large subunit n=1 Tax=Bengtsoniella intestinalis TaxID=3073143 RepID=UPI00391FAF79